MSLFLTALVMGVFSGGHCLGMCGPLVLALPVSEKGFGSALAARILYNTGRIFTYVLLGAIVGSLGAAANLKGFQKYLSYIAGSLLILISLLQLTPLLQIHFLSRAQAGLRNLLTRAAGKSGPGRFTLLGVANGFLPCGMVAMALMASIAAGTLKDGMLYMFFFGLGTFPLMLAASLFGVYLKPKLRGFLTVAGPIYGIALGILLLLRPGWILPDCG